MKSSHACPACGLMLDWIDSPNGLHRLFCGSVRCKDAVCASGVEVDCRFGEDSNDAYDALKASYDKSKGKE